MSITNKISSYFLSPDGVRQVLSFLRKFNESHTPKEYGCDDMNGSQYVGTVQNFGSELLLETRKMLLDLPSLKHINVNDSLDYYFNIKYSNVISTYNQQNLLVATLKKDVLLSNKTYSIEFRNCKKKNILRSKSWSDPDVYRDNYISTNTPPVLIITDNDSSHKEEMSLSINETEYLYNLNSFSSNMIEEYDEDRAILKLINISDNMFDKPMIWFCVDKLKTLPDIKFNSIINDVEYLTLGTDGHNITRLYPFSMVNDMTSDGYIKAVFYEDDDRDIYTKHVKEISFCFNSNNETHNIEIDNDIVDILLSKEVDWNYDKDNNCSYISFDNFNSNLLSNNGSKLISAFIIRFDDKYIHPLEKYCVDLISGIHIDASSEYSDNSISKKNGVINDLGDFDGLPEYFKYLLDRTIHRSHIELYTIRDGLSSNSKATNKQTAALILDTGIPKNEVNDFLEDLPIIIKYDIDSEEYICDGESPSEFNTLSEITYIDDDTFGNCTMDGQNDNLKFIYHGDNLFTLHNIEKLDSKTEYSRIYYISNDDISYDNNERSNNVKPSRCLCRICDIPTSFVQLIKIENISPTLVIDKDYVRTESSYSKQDKELIWNGLTHRLVVDSDITNDQIMIFSNEDNLNEILNHSNKMNNYREIKNLNTEIDIATSGEFTIESGGDDYSVGDTFNHILGGISIFGTVSEVENGKVRNISITSIDSENTNVSNLSGVFTTCETTTITGQGNGLTLTYKLNDDVVKNVSVSYGDLLEGLFALKFDKYNNIWIWEYDNDSSTWNQKYMLVGSRIEENVYDDERTFQDRTLSDVFLKNLISSSNNIISDKRYLLSDKNLNWISRKKCDISSYVDETSDISSELIGINEQDSMYYYDDSSEFSDKIVGKHTYGGAELLLKTYTLPRFHNLNLSSYKNKYASIAYVYEDKGQITPFIYNPIKDYIENTEEIHTGFSKRVGKRQLTFRDMISEIESIKIDDEGIINKNIYVYNELNESEELLNFKARLDGWDHETLISYIKETYGEYNDPIYMEGTAYEFSDKMLREYIIQNTLINPIYKKSDITLMRRANDKVVDKISDDEYIGVGDQPKGLYINISEEVIDSNVEVNGKPYEIDCLLFFKIDQDLSPEDLEGFRLIDENGFDVTDNAILICKNTRMIFMSNTWVILN